LRVPWRKPRDRARWLPIYLRVGRRRSGQSHRSRSKVRAPDANSDYIFHVRSRRASPRRSRSSARPRVAPGPPALGLPNAIEHASRRLIARIPRARATRRAHDANISSASDASIARSPRRRLARCLPANRARRRLGSRPRSTPAPSFSVALDRAPTRDRGHRCVPRAFASPRRTHLLHDRRRASERDGLDDARVASDRVRGRWACVVLCVS
jgi:hypothetical protein